MEPLVLIIASVCALVIIGLIIITKSGDSKAPNVITGDAEQDFPYLKENDIVMYFAEWCGSCQALRPKYEEAKKDPRVAHLKFIEIDTDKNATPDYIETVPAIMKGSKRYDNDPDVKKMIEFFLD